VLSFAGGKLNDKIIKFDMHKRQKSVFDLNGKLVERKDVINDFSFRKFTREYSEDCIAKSVIFALENSTIQIGHADLNEHVRYYGNFKDKKPFGIGCIVNENSKRIGYFLNGSENIGFGVWIHDDISAFGRFVKNRISDHKVVYNSKTHVFFEEYKSSNGNFMELSRGIGFPFKDVAELFVDSSNEYLLLGTSKDSLYFPFELGQSFQDPFLDQVLRMLGNDKGKDIKEQNATDSSGQIQHTKELPNLKSAPVTSKLTGDKAYSIEKQMKFDVSEKLRENKLFKKQEFLSTHNIRDSSRDSQKTVKHQTGELKSKSKPRTYLELSASKKQSDQVVSSPKGEKMITIRKNKIPPEILEKDSTGRVYLVQFNRNSKQFHP